MRRLLDRITGNNGTGGANQTPRSSFVENSGVGGPVTPSQRQTPQGNTDPGRISPKGRIIAPRAKNFLQRFGSKSNNSRQDVRPAVDDEKAMAIMQLAAQDLKSIVDSILKDSEELSSGNMTSFVRLIEMLESDEERPDQIGYNALRKLIANSSHEKYIEICNNYDLGNTFFNIMRLLRLYEVKQTRVKASFLGDTDKGEALQESVTLRAAELVMDAFLPLLLSPQTIESLRPSIVSVLVFPFSLLPENALHFQEFSTQIVYQICKPGLTSQMVWYLHDQQTMHHMATQLRKLTALHAENVEMSRSALSLDCSLRGLESEDIGMWAAGLKSVIDVISASVSISPVLMVDFDRAGGFKTIAHILENSSVNRSMDVMNATMTLFFDPNHKSDDPVSFSEVGIIFSDLLTSIFALSRRIGNDESLEKMIGLSQQLQLHYDSVAGKEHVIQSFSYSLLTIYSNDPRNCNILEEHYHYLPTLLVALPSMSFSDTISAVLTTLNYVCQCVETAATLPLLALCASSSTIVNTLTSEFSEAEMVQRANMQYDLILSSYDSILRSSGRYATVLIHLGWLKYMVCDPFDRLCKVVDQSTTVSSAILLHYEKLITLLVNVDRRGQFISDEIFKCGLLASFMFLINAAIIPHTFTRKLLSVYESISMSKTSIIRSSMTTIMDILIYFSCNYPAKSEALIDSLRNVLLLTEEAPFVWNSLDGNNKILGLMKTMNNVFSSENSTVLNPLEASYFNFLSSIALLFFTIVQLDHPHIAESDYSQKSLSFLRLYESYCNLLQNTNIFNSHYYGKGSLSLLFTLIYGESEEKRFENPSATICLFLLFRSLSSDLRFQLVNILKALLHKDQSGAQALVSAGIIEYLIDHFFGFNWKEDSDICQQILDIINTCLWNHLRGVDLGSLLKYVIRPLFLMKIDEEGESEAMGSDGTSSSGYYQQLLPPWISYYENQSESNYFQYLSSIIESSKQSLPCVSLGCVYGKPSFTPSYLSMILNESYSLFPQQAFSYSVWFQLPNSSNESYNGMITLLSLTTTLLSATGCFLEIQLCCHNFDVLVMFRQGQQLFTLKYKPPLNFSQLSWNLLAFSYKRGKRFPTASKHIVNMYLNGLPCDPIEIDGIDTEIPQISTAVEFVIGKSYVDTLETVSERPYDTPCWNLGPCAFFDDYLMSNQIGVIYFKGPRYCGTYQGLNTIEAGTAITYLLNECNHPTKSAEIYLEAIGLKGIESVVDLSSEVKYEIPSLPKPILIFTADRLVSTMTRETIPRYACLSNIGEKLLYRKNHLYLLNSANFLETEQPLARLFNCHSTMTLDSFSESTASLGGPMVFFPILQYASTGSSICQALQLIRHSVGNNIANIKYMKRMGYKVMAFILSLKPSSIMTINVLDELFEFCVVRSYDDSTPKIPTTLLSDMSALFYLIINHQVWDVQRYSSVMRVLEHLSSLILDARYGFLNTKRLSSIQLTTWLLHLSLFGTDQCSENVASDTSNPPSLEKSEMKRSRGSTSSSSIDKWIMKYSSDDTLSKNNDEKDPFLNAVMLLLLRIIGVDVRQRDLDLIAQIICITFSPRSLMSSSKKSNQSMQSPIESELQYDRSSTSQPILSLRENINNRILFGRQTRDSKQPLVFDNTTSFLPYQSSFEQLSSPFHQLRVYLIRLLYGLYENHYFGSQFTLFRKQNTAIGMNAPSNHLFYKVFHYDWMMNCIEVSVDIASRSYALRLLGLFMQTDTQYYHEFCSRRGAKLLENILFTVASSLSDKQLLPLALPLIALTFQIPIQLLPYPFQVNASEKILQIVHLEECRGPDCSDNEGPRFTLSMISLLLSYICILRNNESKGDLDEGSEKYMKPEKAKNNIVNDTTIRLLLHYFENEVAFRQLLQNRQGVEMIASSIISLSNAVDDYGSHIYSSPLDISPNLSNDLDSFIKDDYIVCCNDMERSSFRSVRVIENDGDIATSMDRKYIYMDAKPLILRHEGNRLLKLLRNVIDSAFKEFANTYILSHIILSFPSNMEESFTYSYQHLVIQQANFVIEEMVQKNFGSQIMAVISNGLLLLIPIAKSRVLNVSIQLEVLDVIFDLIERLQSFKESNKKFEELYSPILRELTLSARYFAATLLHHCSTSYILSYVDGESFAVSVLQKLRMNILKLIPRPMDESLDLLGSSSKFLVSKANQQEERTPSVGLAVLDSYQLSWISEANPQTKRFSSVDTFSLCISERLRISNSFFVLAVNSSFNLFTRYHHTVNNDIPATSPRGSITTLQRSHSNEENVLLESLRIIVLLSLHRRSSMKQLFSPESQLSGNTILNRTKYYVDIAQDEIDFFEVGIMKILPPKSLQQNYLMFLAGTGNDSSEESKRIQEFCNWFYANDSMFHKYIRPIDMFIKSILPSVSENTSVIRQIQASKLRERPSIAPGNKVGDMTSGLEYASRQGSKVCATLRVWKVRGVASLAAGMILWKRCYESLQTSPIWGYEPLSSSNDMINESSGLLKNIDNYRGCRLDPAEGPEKMRRKLTQDYSLYQTKLWEKIISEIGIKITQRSHSIDVEKDDSTDRSVGVNESIAGDISKTHESENKIDMMAKQIEKMNHRNYLVRGKSSRDSVRGSVISKWMPQNISMSGILTSFTENNSQDAPDMEQFMKEMAKQGILKRQEIVSSSVFDSVETEERFEAESVAKSDITSNLGTLSLDDLDRSAENDPYNHIPRPVLMSEPSEVFDTNNISIEIQSPSGDPNPLSLESNMSPNYIGKLKYSLDITKSMVLEEVLKGLVGLHDWNQAAIYNVERICGLENSRGLLIVSDENIYFVNGLAMNRDDLASDDSISGKYKPPSYQDSARSPMDRSSGAGSRVFEWLLDTNTPSATDLFHDSNAWKSWLVNVWKEIMESDIGYNKTPFNEVLSVFKRRHHLKYTALEYTNIHGYSILISSPTVDESSKILSKFFQASNLPILFRSINNFKLISLKNPYNAIISQFLSSLTKLWQNGEISNFEYIIQLNSVAGRSFLDLTQYPVFPWILSDYTSNSLDLSNPNTFRDLSKPMGALGEKRCIQFLERFRTMDEFQQEGVENSPPPFHYGTHYSCAGYVLYYLIRLQPYSNYAIALQGGQFDISDRLFLCIENSWTSSSSENLQDVRELIPEFFYLPEFLMNLNQFNFGTTQRGQVVNDVELPPWANNSPYEFIRLHREALESKYVSEHLNDWIDLIFGYKQRGEAAEKALNVFIHVTYEGAVDIDSITDPIMQSATIAQINNFGQSPSKLFNRPHAKRFVPDIVKRVNDSNFNVDVSALSWHSHLSPPLSVVGAVKLIYLNKVSYSQILANSSPLGKESHVSDIFYISNKLAALTIGSISLPSTKKILRYLIPSGAVAFANLPIANQRDQDREVVLIDSIHSKEVTSVAISKTADLLATGSKDSAVKLWQICCKSNKDYSLDHIYTFTGHKGTIVALDMNTDFSILVSCSMDHSVGVWNISTGHLRFMITDHTSEVISASINAFNGNIVTISSTHIHICTINGDLISFENLRDHQTDSLVITNATAVFAPSTSEYHAGVVAVTGHLQGYVYFWRISSAYDNPGAATDTRESLPCSRPCMKRLLIAQSLPRTHRANISCIKLINSGSTSIGIGPGARFKEFVDRTFDDSNMTSELYIGDTDGFVSRWSVQRLDQFSQNDIQNAVSL